MSEIYRGIQGVDITTAGHLSSPQELFEITDTLNRDRDPSNWVGIEVYPMVERTLFPDSIVGAMNAILGRIGMGVLPQGVNTDDIYEWQRKFPNTRVERVHLPFSADVHELLHRPVLGELENGPKYMAYAAAWVFFFGAATNMQGIKLARDLSAGINSHTNVIEYFAKNGRIGELKQGVPLLLAENERDFKSPVLKNREAIFDPRTIVEEIVKKYDEVDGLLLGLDHEFPPDQDLASFLDDEDLTSHIFAMHISHPQAQGKSTHDLVHADDPRFEPFLRRSAQTVFQHPLRVALDYNPLLLSKMSLGEKTRHYQSTIRWIEESQGV